MRGAGYAFDGDAAVKPSPEIPAQNPAALDPFWKNGRLTVSKETVKTELSTEIFGYALSGLRQELHKFAEEIAAESNIDRRFVSFLQNTADLIPDTSPPQDVLFRLGHIEELFLGYAEIVNSEWPDFLAKRYRAIMLNYDRTMRQSSVWRNFKRNAALQTLSKDQTLAAKPLASEAASRLRQEEASQFVDPHVADALERLAESLKRSKLPPDVMEAKLRATCDRPY